eukprot:TRINITY_DN2749_c0_g1_i1.p1 TRINITY_DN2749_c0_g1~~TRINITY_DN2749_c0_g1_i1.p1  ORF type:complete len:221 (-),score=45.89 TRINITY_DN2749_c0_g1_i1:34-696(-)
MDKSIKAYPNLFEGKILLLGNSLVGKTSIAIRFVKEQWLPKTNPTIGASFLTKELTLGPNKIKLQIWDTAGQERFRSLAPMYYREAAAALLIFDLTEFDSFSKLHEWVSELQSNVEGEIILLLIGNKADKVQEEKTNRKVSFDAAQDYASSINASYHEVSAKSGQSIEEIFVDVAKKIIEKKKSLIPAVHTTESVDNINPIIGQPHTNRTNPDNSSGCCS